MAYTFIANSGIQFYLSHVTIDLNATSKHLFHEWFDEELVETSLEVVYQLPESKKIVALNDLERYRLISDEGKLLVGEQQVLAIPDLRVIFEGDVSEADGIFALKLSDRRCPLSALLNKWLPIPMLELDLLGEFKQGPYNWCRCKIIPTGEIENGTLNADVLFAFDTRALYQETTDDYAECPTFENISEKSKDFKLCDKITRLLDFCSGNNAWVKSYLLEIVHGVREIDDIRVNKNEQDYRYAFLASYFLLIEYLQSAIDLPTFRLIRDRDVENVNVEMVVDIGNSRTAAVILRMAILQRCSPLNYKISPPR